MDREAGCETDNIKENMKNIDFDGGYTKEALLKSSVSVSRPLKNSEKFGYPEKPKSSFKLDPEVINRKQCADASGENGDRNAFSQGGDAIPTLLLQPATKHTALPKQAIPKIANFKEYKETDQLGLDSDCVAARCGRSAESISSSKLPCSNLQGKNRHLFGNMRLKLLQKLNSIYENPDSISEFRSEARGSPSINTCTKSTGIHNFLIRRENSKGSQISCRKEQGDERAQASACSFPQVKISADSRFIGGKNDKAKGEASRFVIVPENIHMDKRKTCMIKNIPNKYTSNKLQEFINQTHYGAYEFIYLRMDFANQCNVGYAFISFAKLDDLQSFYFRIHGHKWSMFGSEKIAQLTYASIQGLDNLIKRFKNSSILERNKEYRPKLFYTQGKSRGQERLFSDAAKTPYLSGTHPELPKF